MRSGQLDLMPIKPEVFPLPDLLRATEYAPTGGKPGTGRRRFNKECGLSLSSDDSETTRRAALLEA